jgi:hypothetical protein
MIVTCRPPGPTPRINGPRKRVARITAMAIPARSPCPPGRGRGLRSGCVAISSALPLEVQPSARTPNMLPRRGGARSSHDGTRSRSSEISTPPETRSLQPRVQHTAVRRTTARRPRCRTVEFPHPVRIFPRVHWPSGEHHRRRTAPAPRNAEATVHDRTTLAAPRILHSCWRSRLGPNNSRTREITPWA